MATDRWHQLSLPDELMPRARVTTSGPAPVIQARAEIVRLRSEGYGLTDVAKSLNARGVPTPSGRGRWWPDTVRRHVNPGPWADYIRQYRQTHR